MSELKIRLLLTAALLAVGLTEVVRAESYLGVTGGAFASWHADNSQVTSAKLGGGGELTFSYHAQRDNLLFMVGVSAAFASNRVAVDDIDDVISIPATDSRGIDYLMVADMKDREGRNRMTDLKLPVLLGGEWASWYFLAGPVFVANLKTSTYDVASIRTKGRYDRYYEDLVNMPQHGFHDFEKTETKGSLRFRYDVRLAVETGYTFQLQRTRFATHTYTDSALRLGLFAEIGVLNINPNRHNPLVGGRVVDNNGTTHITLSPVYGSDLTADNWVRSMSVGVRLTYLIRIKARVVNHCNCYN